MQNQLIQSYIEKFNEKVKDTKTRAEVLPIIIGVALGSFTKANTDEQLNDKTVYNDLYAANLARIVSFINEHTVLDVNKTLGIAALMHEYRSKLTKGVPAIYSLTPGYSFVQAAFGAPFIFTKEDLESLEKLGDNSQNLLQNALLLISKLRENGTIKI